MADPFDHPRDQHPACVASGCKCMPKAHCIGLCVETLKMTLTPERIARIARSEMPACFNVTRELLVAVAQKALEIPRLQQKLLLDTGKGCSVCGHTPVVNVSGTYWLCGDCVLERIESPQQQFVDAARRFAGALLEGDRLDALAEGECTDSEYQQACDEYNLSKRLMGEAYAGTLIDTPAIADPCEALCRECKSDGICMKKNPHYLNKERA